MSENEKSRLQFRNWKNQYIDLVDQSADDIISITTAHVPDEKRSQLRERLKKYSKIVCEIGSGSGGHLLELAKRSPDALHIGIELRFKRAFRTVEKGKQSGLHNILMVRGDARLIADFFETDEIDTIHLNFPDPWDKPRWHKNRILNAAYLDALVSLLKPGGLFSHKSDHQAYFAESLSSVEKNKFLEVLKSTKDLYKSEEAATSVPSEFEMMFKSQGLPIGYLLARKIGGNSLLSV